MNQHIFFFLHFFLHFFQLCRISCGDGVRVPGEECDDGNIVNNDGCTNECMIEPGYICRGGNTTYLSADRCNPGLYMVDLDFEQETYTTDSINIKTYNVMEWNRNPSLPKIYEHVKKDGTGVGAFETRRKGSVELEVTTKAAHSGTNGMRLHFRDYYYTKEYSPSTAEITNFELGLNEIYSESTGTILTANEFTDLTTVPNTQSTDLGKRVTSLNGVAGWVHGPWLAATKRVARTWTAIKIHSLVRVKLRFWVHGNWCADDHVAIDINGDTVFTHTKHQAGVNEKFRDGLYDGSAFGTAYVSPLSNAGASTTKGYMKRRYWNKIEASSGISMDYTLPDADPVTWRTYDVDVVVPHQDSKLTLNVRAIMGSCGNSAAWAFDKVQIQVSDVTAAPFRPYNIGQLRNRNTVQQDAHSWLQFDTPDPVKQASFLSFSFKAMKIARTGRQFIINLIDLDHATRDVDPWTHGNCLSDAGCTAETGCTACRPTNVYYRICYWNQRSASGASGCDESHFPTYGVWHDETITPRYAIIYLADFVLTNISH